MINYWRGVLETEARIRGVRVISVGEFLKYMNYKVSGGPAVPAEYKLKSGPPPAIPQPGKGAANDAL
jgi:hypothetical protein